MPPLLAACSRGLFTLRRQDYSDAQLNAWAPKDLDDAGRADWATARAAARTVVAVDNREVVGFSDLVDGTLLDMLYVEPRYAGRGVGSALISTIVRLARAGGASVLETDASLTARPVFERYGFAVVTQQTPYVRDVAMTNCKMRLNLGSA